MSDFQEPPLRLTVAGLRWGGEDWEPEGTSGTISLYGTDYSDEEIAVLRSLRGIAVQRVTMNIASLALRFDGLDFDAPNAPTTDDVKPLIESAEHLTEALRVLTELSPEVLPDEDEDEDEEVTQ